MGQRNLFFCPINVDPIKGTFRWEIYEDKK